MEKLAEARKQTPNQSVVGTNRRRHTSVTKTCRGRGSTEPQSAARPSGVRALQLGPSGAVTSHRTQPSAGTSTRQEHGLAHRSHTELVTPAAEQLRPRDVTHRFSAAGRAALSSGRREVSFSRAAISQGGCQSKCDFCTHMTHVSGGWEARAQQSVPGTPPAAAAHPGYQRGHHEGKEEDKAPA